MERCIKSELNEIYKSLCTKSNEICDGFKKAGFKVASGFHNNHYVRNGEGFCIEHYPIPVLGIAGVGDVGIDIDATWMEIVLDKKIAVSLDYPSLARLYSFEVYGSENFLSDFHNEQSSPHEIVEKLQACDESQICITFTFPRDCSPDNLIDLARQFE